MVFASVSQRKHKDLEHYVPMKFRSGAGLLFSVSLLVVGAPAALAHEFPSPIPVPGVAPLSEQEQYMLAQEHYRFDTNAFKRISRTFTNSVNRANNVYEAAMRTAKSDRARTTITAQRDSSIEIAINMRDAAIEEMGGAPVEPIKPVKPIATATTKKTKTSNPSPTPSP